MRSLLFFLPCLVFVACSDDEIPTIGPPIHVESSPTEPPSHDVMCAQLDAGSG